VETSQFFGFFGSGSRQLGNRAKPDYRRQPRTHMPSTGDGPQKDRYDDRIAWWCGKRIYLGRNTQLCKLFWLLSSQLGRARSVEEIIEVIDEKRIEAGRRAWSQPERLKAEQRVRKVVSRLRSRLGEEEVDAHAVIVREKTPHSAYVMIRRFSPTQSRSAPTSEAIELN
jgi:hypothetical protein